MYINAGWVFFQMQLLTMIFFFFLFCLLLSLSRRKFSCKERGGGENFVPLPSQYSISVLSLQNEALEKQLNGGNISLVVLYTHAVTKQSM